MTVSPSLKKWHRSDAFLSNSSLSTVIRRKSQSMKQTFLKLYVSRVKRKQINSSSLRSLALKSDIGLPLDKKNILSGQLSPGKIVQ